MQYLASDLNSLLHSPFFFEKELYTLNLDVLVLHECIPTSIILADIGLALPESLKRRRKSGFY